MEFEPLVLLFEKIEKTTKRSEKTFAISTYLSQISSKEDLDMSILLLQGKLFSDVEQTQLGVSAQTVIKAMKVATGYSDSEITTLWKQKGDLGLVGEQISGQKKQATLFIESLTITKMFSHLKKLATLEGSGSVDQKVKLIADLLAKAQPKEAKYIIRYVLEVMRLGIGGAILRDALVWTYFPKVTHLFAYNKTTSQIIPTTQGFETNESDELVALSDISSLTYSQKLSYDVDYIACESEKDSRELYDSFVALVQKALDMTNDTVLVAQYCFDKNIDALKLSKPQVGKPIQVMLAKKVNNAKEGIDAVGSPCIVEYKYDGFRMQIHKQGDLVTLYTRRLEEVTKQFPEVVQAVQKNVSATNCILDAEAVGYDTQTHKYTAFQQISQRIKRKHNIERLQKDFPVELNVFDIILLEDKAVLEKPLKERRELLEKIITSEKLHIVLSEAKQLDNVPDIQEFYEKSLKAGNEGVMLKTLDAQYKPGSRVGFMIKLKPVMDTLDLVITKATWGEGKRTDWLTSFVLCAQDEDGQLVELGRVGTGFKEDDSELSFANMTTMLEPLIIKEDGKDIYVKPEIVLEVAYEEIQQSQSYSSGFALRFPRVIRLREKGVENISTTSLIEEFYYSQRGRN